MKLIVWVCTFQNSVLVQVFHCGILVTPPIKLIVMLMVKTIFLPAQLLSQFIRTKLFTNLMPLLTINTKLLFVNLHSLLLRKILSLFFYFFSSILHFLLLEVWLPQIIHILHNLGRGSPTILNPPISFNFYSFIRHVI